MCGIFGEVGSSEEVAPPLAGIAHRGPDDSGVWRGRGVLFGHCRLAIIDLEGGKQPWVEGERALTYNGEIYNFRQLREELRREGVRFRSRSDTEVLFRMLERYGEEAVGRLDGMFAFGFWDGRRLILARDRFGVKPLYWTRRGERLAFASEIKALLSLPWVPKRPNMETLKFHLTFLWAPYPDTAYEGIYKLPPGHILIWEDGKVRLRRYYDPLSDYGEGRVEPQEVLATLKDSVGRQMVADVEVGLFLSGGIDSSAIAALVPRPLRAFTLRFRREDLRREIFASEERYARAVAEAYGHELVPVEVPFSAETFSKVIWHLEEPIGDGAAISNYLLSEGARRMGLKVALTGVGGDELWGGYPRYRALLLARRFPFLRFLPELPFSSGRLGRLARDLNKFKRAASLPFPLRYLRWMGYYDLYGDVYERLLRVFPKVEDDLAAAMLFDISYFLPEHNLLYTDKTSMAHGLEVRVPFLSNDLLRLALRTPSAEKVSLREGKIILKRALKGVLPDGILRRRKAGFGAPVKGWMSGPLRTLLEGIGEDPLIASLLPKGTVEEVLRENLHGRGFLYLQAFQLLTLSVWRRVFSL
ncbi:MAG: asparagine synthase (glutamine-hydrolyzing) [Thermotogae bacterium]|nr:asparagine synthase (glutamine-hydrolyzing) [Thermotogota bacterium]